MSAPTSGADLEGDPAKDHGEWLALRSLPYPATAQQHPGHCWSLVLATSIGDKALPWECTAQSHCHLHPLAHKPCFVSVLHLETDTASPGLGRKGESSREGKEGTH